MDVLHCPVQHYEWGSTTAIPALLGVEPDGRPQAELWAGAHPAAPSTVGGRSLAEVIADDPEAALGRSVLERFGPRLPFLAKLLAAAEPLSIQAHPDKRRAEAGFDDEEARRVPIDAPHRRYKDRNHKPEILVALTPFVALAGFRPVEETVDLLRSIGLAHVAPFNQLEVEGPAAVVGTLLHGGDRDLAARVADAVRAAPIEVATWLGRIAEVHPGDPGVSVSLLLNLVTLQPGQAVNLRAGNLHAYLEGTGVEVMASSDNVLRGGLTPKHIDVDELLAVLDPAPGPPPVVEPVGRGRVRRWPTPDPDFAVTEVSPGTLPHEVRTDGPSVVLVLDDPVAVASGCDEIELLPGTVLWVPASDGAFRLRGDGRAFVVGVAA